MRAYKKIEFISKIKSLIKKHASLFVLAVASISFLILNILLKDILTDIEYGKYSILISCISFLSLFGLFGFDHVFIRTAIIKDKKIILDSRLISVTLLIIIISVLVFNFSIDRYYNFGVSNFMLILLTSSILLLKISHQLLRSLSMFVISQLTLNLWKIGLLLFIFLSIYLGININLQAIIFSILVFCLFALASYLPLLSKIDLKILDYSSTDLLKLGLGFLLAIGSVTILSFFERFIIEKKFGLSDFGNYFFYVNIYLYPFLFLSTYIGFKELVAFKKTFTNVVLKQKLIQTLRGTILLGFLYFIITIIIQNMGIYDLKISQNLPLILALVFWGVVRIIAALLSSAIGAVGDQKDLNKINIYSGALFLFLFLLIPLVHTIIGVVILFIVIWVLRYSAYYFLLLKK